MLYACLGPAIARFHPRKCQHTSGAVVQNADVTILNPDTGLKRSARTNFEDLPIGLNGDNLARRISKEGVYNIVVQANRTATVSTRLKARSAETTMEVTGTPLLHKVDTTNGYVLRPQQIEEVPLGTGSFTQLAILSPGVNADLLGGSGTNSGFGNRAIWANGQRDTSNSFSSTRSTRTTFSTARPPAKCSQTTHGQAYEYFQTSAWNAAPYFCNANPTIPPSQKVPYLSRNMYGGTLGGPIVKNKLFFCTSYQGVRVFDELAGPLHSPAAHRTDRR